MNFNLILLCLSLVPLYLVPVDGRWCESIQNVRKSRLVWKTSTRIVTRRRWWGKIERREEPDLYRGTEYYYDTERVHKCCSGYTQYENTCIAKCEPTCPEHSQCVEPNVCHCDVGYYSFSTDPRQADCKASCAESCPENSECTRPQVCECKPGYNRLNGDDGTFVCQPECSRSCGANSYCAASETCACSAGFTELRSGSGLCEPVCDPKCPENAHCEAPNKCKCSNGFQLDQNNRQCQPICRSACPTNSVCTAPDVCRCYDGYAMSDDGTNCEPQCTATQCPEHAICHRPNECLCNAGYRMQRLASDPNLHCEPECARNCTINGKCISPGVCECYPGYELKKNSDPNVPLCQPKCSTGCKNGACRGPETCICNDGFLMGPHKECTPHCVGGCINGNCIAPEKCECKPGFRPHGGNVMNVCDPICEPACVNATCAAPNLCLCLHDYEPAITSHNEHQMGNICKPTCLDCKNGDCVGPHKCQCWPGFEMNLNTRTCMPTSSGPTSTTTHIDNRNAFDTEPVVPSTSADVELVNKQNSFRTPSAAPTTTNVFVAASSCHQHCKCWQTFDAVSTHRDIPCMTLCMDEYDEPCLDLNNCQCDAQQLQLVCPNTGQDTEQPFIRYRCGIRFFPTTTVVANKIYMTDALELDTGKDKHWSFRNPLMWLIICSCVIGSIIVSISIYAIWTWRSHRHTALDDYIINYQQ